MPDTTTEAHLQAALEAAAAAASCIRPYFRQPLSADTKTDESPVTAADREAEAAMRAVLAKAFPTHAIIGEEHGTEREGADWCWVLDPIDGTRAFITGRPLFGTLIALLHQGRPVLGVLDQPITAERWVGRAGLPTTFTGAFGQVGVRPCPRLSEAELSCTAPEIFSAPLAERFGRLRRAARRVTWGGDCYAYGLVALGGVDVVAEAGLKPWDWAALVPIIQGAGGTVTSWDGRPLALGTDGSVLATGDAALHHQALDLLQDQR